MLVCSIHSEGNQWSLLFTSVHDNLTVQTGKSGSQDFSTEARLCTMQIKQTEFSLCAYNGRPGSLSRTLKSSLVSYWLCFQILTLPFPWNSLVTQRIKRLPSVFASCSESRRPVKQTEDLSLDPPSRRKKKDSLCKTIVNWHLLWTESHFISCKGWTLPEHKANTSWGMSVLWNTIKATAGKRPNYS